MKDKNRSLVFQITRVVITESKRQKVGVHFIVYGKLLVDYFVIRFEDKYPNV